MDLLSQLPEALNENAVMRSRRFLQNKKVEFYVVLIPQICSMELCNKCTVCEYNINIFISIVFLIAGAEHCDFKLINEVNEFDPFPVDESSRKI